MAPLFRRLVALFLSLALLIDPAWAISAVSRPARPLADTTCFQRETLSLALIASLTVGAGANPRFVVPRQLQLYTASFPSRRRRRKHLVSGLRQGFERLWPRTPASPPSTRKEAQELVTLSEHVIQTPGLEDSDYLSAHLTLRRIQTLFPDLLQGRPVTQTVLSISDQFQGHPLIALPYYQDPHFLNESKSWTAAKRYSVSFAARRLLHNAGLTPTAPLIRKSVQLILEWRRRHANRILIGRQTTVVILLNEEARFNAQRLMAIAFKAGARKILGPFRGVEEKDAALEAIRQTRGKLTILFDGHGAPGLMALKHVGSFVLSAHSEVSSLGITSYELARALIDRNSGRSSLRDVAILLSACYSHDFAMRVLRSLSMVLRSDLPIVAASASPGRVSYGHYFFYGIAEAQPRDNPLRLRHLLAADGHTFTANDNIVLAPISPVDVKYRLGVDMKGLHRRVAVIGSLLLAAA